MSSFSYASSGATLLIMRVTVLADAFAACRISRDRVLVFSSCRMLEKGPATSNWRQFFRSSTTCSASLSASLRLRPLLGASPSQLPLLSQHCPHLLTNSDAAAGTFMPRFCARFVKSAVAAFWSPFASFQQLAARVRCPSPYSSIVPVHQLGQIMKCQFECQAALD